MSRGGVKVGAMFFGAMFQQKWGRNFVVLSGKGEGGKKNPQNLNDKTLF